MENHMGSKQLNDSKYRYERKFTVDDTVLVSTELFSKGYYKQHPNRRVNSIYFDDDQLTSYYENINGLSRRKKYRIRFYGDLNEAKKFVFEVKVKHEYGNYKISETYVLDRDLIAEEKLSLLINKASRIDWPKNIRPILHLYYSRDYYFNPIENVRVTIDKNISIKKYNSGSLNLIRNPKVVEVKMPVNNNNFETIKSIGQVQRFSKYCFAISFLNIVSETY